MRRLALALAVALLTASAACSSAPDGQAAPTSTSAPAPPTTTAPSATTMVAATTTSSTAPPVAWPAIPTSGAVKALVTPGGVIVPVLSAAAGGGYVVQTPCVGQASVTDGTPLYGANVVLDAGHGGDETGAVGPGGLTEKSVNLAVVLDVQRMLQDAGATVVLTRGADYRITLNTRGLIATGLQPSVFVSIHHNAEPDGPRDGPGTETYYQIASPSSKRLAGLIYEEVVAALSPYRLAWVADSDAGAKYRLTSSGGDYYGILSRTEGATGVLSELGFITNAPETALLATPEYQQVEAAAVARAIIRYMSTDDPGAGYVTPYPRTEPAGAGGGTSGCVDPAL